MSGSYKDRFKVQLRKYAYGFYLAPMGALVPVLLGFEAAKSFYLSFIIVWFPLWIAFIALSACGREDP